MSWMCKEYLSQQGYVLITGDRLNMKMSHQYRDPHIKDKTVVWPSYLIYHGNPHTWKDGLYNEIGPEYYVLPFSTDIPLALSYVENTAK